MKLVTQLINPYSQKFTKANRIYLVIAGVQIKCNNPFTVLISCRLRRLCRATPDISNGGQRHTAACRQRDLGGSQRGDIWKLCIAQQCDSLIIADNETTWRHLIALSQQRADKSGTQSHPGKLRIAKGNGDLFVCIAFNFNA